MKILAIGAHRDDIELGCGGSLAQAAEGAHRVQLLCLSDSASVRFDGTVLRTREEAVREGRLAAATPGSCALEILDFPTKHIHDDPAAVEALDERIAAFAPDIVFRHWPFHTHQYADITAQIDEKLTALRCHESQCRKYGEEWIDAVRARARFRG